MLELINLNVSNNEIFNISSIFRGAPNLKELYANNNQILQVEKVPKNMEKLDLSSNNINIINSFMKQKLNNLVNLNLKNNKFNENLKTENSIENIVYNSIDIFVNKNKYVDKIFLKNYRLKIINNFPNLISLDNIKINKKEYYIALKNENEEFNFETSSSLFKITTSNNESKKTKQILDTEKNETKKSEKNSAKLSEKNESSTSKIMLKKEKSLTSKKSSKNPKKSSEFEKSLKSKKTSSYKQKHKISKLKMKNDYLSKKLEKLDKKLKKVIFKKF